ncbi:MAG: tetratricopeptide repeat protein [Planctomycetota bacterium]|jgi:tetratricopeptide (TPR) repeat protein
MGEKAKRNLWRGLLALLIVLASLLAYDTSLNNDFTNWDDNWLITGNPWVREVSRGNVSTILDPTVDPNIRAQLGGEYLPVRDFSTMADYALFGLQPAGHHATNLVLHTLVCLLLFLLLLRLFDSAPLAFGASLLFAVHPLHVESVAWLSSRKDLLAGVFYLLALLAWNAHRRRGGLWRGVPFYTCAFLCYVLACTSKYMAVTLPAALLLHDWLLFRPRPTGLKARLWRPLLETLPFFVFTILFAKLIVVRIASRGLIREWYGDGFIHTLYSVLHVMVEYVAAIFVPTRLQACVDHPIARTLDFPTLGAAAFLVGLIGFGLTILLRALFRERDPSKADRLVAFSGLFFFAAISPVSNVLFPMGTLYADRYLYLPLLGGPLLLGALFAAGFERALGDPRKRVAILRGTLAVLALAGVALAYGVKTSAYNRVWKNSETLWSDVLEKGGPGHHTAHFNLGIDAQVRASTQGEWKGRPLFERAEVHLRRALQTGHESYFYDYARVHTALGTVLGFLGREAEAEAAFAEALEINRRNIDEARNDRIREAEKLDRAEILHNRGELRSKSRDTAQVERALLDFRASLELNPDSATTHLNLGLLLLAKEKEETGEESFEGKTHLERARGLDRYLAEAPLNLGILAFNRRDLPRARAWFDEALERHPHLPDAHFYIAAIHLERQEFDLAREVYDRIASTPGLPPEWAVKARVQRAQAFELEGNYVEAEKIYIDVLKIHADAPEKILAPARRGLVDIYGKFGGALLQRKNFVKACDVFGKALQLDPDHPGIRGGLYKAYLGYGNDRATAAVDLDSRGMRQAAVPLYLEAIGAFRLAAEIHSTYEAWYAVGHFSKKVTHLDGVLEAFGKALQHIDDRNLRIDMMKIHLARAAVFLKREKRAKAIEACRRGAEVLPESVDPHRILVSIFDKEAKDWEKKAKKAIAENRPAEVKRARRARREALEKTLEAARAIVERRPKAPPDLSLLGRLLVVTGRKKEAEEVFRKLIEREPKVAQHLVNLAHILEGGPREEEGLGLLKRALSVNPDSSPAKEALLRSLKRTGLKGAVLWKKRHEALLDVDPSRDPKASRERFESAVAAGRFAEERLKEYFARLGPGEEDPLTRKILRSTTAELHTVLGRSLREEDPMKAEVHLRTALAEKSDHPDALWELASLLEEKGELEEAWRTLLVYLAVDEEASKTPTFRDWKASLARRLADAKHASGRSKASEGDGEGALADFDRCIELRPNFPLYHLDRGRVLHDLGRREEALRGIREAIRILETMEGEGGSAARFQRALLAEALGEAGRILTELERWEEAAAEFGRAVQGAPEDSFLRLEWAGALEKAGKGGEAKAQYSKALEGFKALRPGSEAEKDRVTKGIGAAEAGLARLMGD